jgi:hypothetical protein
MQCDMEQMALLIRVGEYLPPNSNQQLWVNNPRTARVLDVKTLPKLPGPSSPYYDETVKLFQQLLPNYQQEHIDKFRYCLYVFCMYEILV